MKRQPEVPTGRRSGLEVHLRLNGSAPLVHGVLDAHQRGPRKVAVCRIHLRTDGLRRHGPARGVDEADARAAVARDATTLVVVDVAQPVTDHLIPWLGVDVDGHLVGHGPRRAEQPGFVAEPLSQHILQSVDRGIFTVDVVAGRGGHHGGEHRLRGPRDRVASQIDGRHAAQFRMSRRARPSSVNSSR